MKLRIAVIFVFLTNKNSVQIVCSILNTCTITSSLADTLLLQTNSESPAKAIEVILKQTSAIPDCRHYELTDT